MSKVLSVARTEYLNAVRSKAFIIGIIFMPLMMGGTIVISKVLEGRVDTEDRRCAVVDRSGDLFPALERRSDERNSKEIFDWDGEEKGRQSSPRFLFEKYEPSADENFELALSDRVRDKELFAFLVIPETLQVGDGALTYHTASPTYQALPRWLRSTFSEEVLARRFAAENIDRALVDRLSERVDVKTLGLVTVSDSGEIQEAQEESEDAFQLTAIASCMLLFMLVMMSAPALLNQVLEEKMQKISEILVSAVSPFQLLLGKLLGTILVSMTLSVLYVGAIYYMTIHFQVSGLVPLSTYGWFFFFQLLAMLMFGSIFSAFGAACTEMRDAQNLMMPAMFIIVIPMMCLGAVIQSPDSLFSRVLSLFPPATPTLMLVRMSIPPGPAAWEIALAVVLTTVFALACVWAAGKIFRIGILAQGQSPTIGRLIRWIFS